MNGKRTVAPQAAAQTIRMECMSLATHSLMGQSKVTSKEIVARAEALAKFVLQS